MRRSKILVVIGPTASGKSELAVRLAKKLNGEIISADSRQIYKSLDIGAGKITKQEMRGVRHHLLDIVNPKKVFTAADFQKLARQKIQEISGRGRLPIICGGTGFYIQAAVDNLILPSVKPNPALRKKLGPLTKTATGLKRLWDKLNELDPARAAKIDSHNPRRLVRALEIALASGSPAEENREKLPYQLTPAFDLLFIGIKLAPEKLKRRIRARLDRRMRQGMMAEVKKLKQRGVSWKRLDELGLEYRYLSRHLRGLMTKKAALSELEKQIILYAKRQITWFRRDRRIRWVKNYAAALNFIRRRMRRARINRVVELAAETKQ